VTGYGSSEAWASTESNAMRKQLGLRNAGVSSYSFFIVGEQEVTLRAAGPGLMLLFPRNGDFRLLTKLG
jgi:hypothetical protein